MAYCGDGATSEGDFHEALNFAGVWHVPVVFVVPEQPVGDLGAAQEADALAHDRPEGAGLRAARPPGGRQRRPRGLRRLPRGGRARAGRRRAHADRVRDLPPRRAHHGRRPDQVPLDRGGRGVGAQGPAHALRRLSGEEEPAGGRAGGRGRRRDRRRRAALRGARRRPTRSRCSTTSTASCRPHLGAPARPSSPPGCATAARPPAPRPATRPPSPPDARPAHEPAAEPWPSSTWSRRSTWPCSRRWSATRTC